jgi:hypothetical protein
MGYSKWLIVTKSKQKLLHRNQIPIGNASRRNGN